MPENRMAMMPGEGQRAKRRDMIRAEKHLPHDTQILSPTSYESLGPLVVDVLRKRKRKQRRK